MTNSTIRAEKKYDFSKLGTQPDNVLSKSWGISRERIRQFRKKYSIPKYDKNYHLREERLEKIKTYLINNDNNIITLKSLSEELNISFCHLSVNYINELIKCLNLNIIFRNQKYFEHSSNTYAKGICRCQICIACRTVSMNLLNKKIKCSVKVVDYVVNNFFDLYESDTAFGHKNFYKFLLNNKYIEIT